MSRELKVRDKIESGKSDAKVRFDDACYLLQHLGFIVRTTRGSHCVFQLGEFHVNLQNRSGKIAPHQAAQFVTFSAS